MPDEEQGQPSQQPNERDSTPGDFSTDIQEARDAEILKASGARPSPNPDAGPTTPGPINKAADLSDAAHQERAIVGDTLSESKTQTEPAPPSPSPTPDSGEEVSQGE